MELTGSESLNSQVQSPMKVNNRGAKPTEGFPEEVMFPWRPKDALRRDCLPGPMIVTADQEDLHPKSPTAQQYLSSHFTCPEHSPS